jgi:hypothetical protein
VTPFLYAVLSLSVAIAVGLVRSLVDARRTERKRVAALMAEYDRCMGRAPRKPYASLVRL